MSLRALMAFSPARRVTPLSPTTRTALRVLVGARWLCWLWMVGIVLFDRGQLRHPVAATALVVGVLGFTIYTNVEVGRRPERLVSAGFVAAEVVLAAALSVLDGYVFDPGHVFETTQSLATQWPLLMTGTVGFAFGPYVAAACGALIGPAEWGGALANGVTTFDLRQTVSLVATSVFFAACGGVFGWLAQSLQRAEAEVADRRAREEVGRVMHDTVLQTLALVERRTATSDPELAQHAQLADRELRAFLFGSGARFSVGSSRDEDLEERIRRHVEAAVRRTPSSARVTVSVIDDGCNVAPESQEMIARAIGEATTNALQHAEASKVVVFADTDDEGEVAASVVDDGVGFDPRRPRSSQGIDESILARMASIGGLAEVRSAADRDTGTEVRLWSRSPASGNVSMDQPVEAGREPRGDRG